MRKKKYIAFQRNNYLRLIQPKQVLMQLRLVMAASVTQEFIDGATKTFGF